MKVVGHITRRRRIGKKLAFADIQIQHVEVACDDPKGRIHDFLDLPKHEEIIQMVFHRRAEDTDSDASFNDFVWDEGSSVDKFPEKNSALPYGALVAIHLCQKSMEECNGRKSYPVKSWELLQNPREEAIDQARTTFSSGEGISCSKYLKSRGEAFLKFNLQETQCWDSQKSKYGAAKERRNKKSTNNSLTGEFGHGDNKAKALRAKIFAEWLIETFGQDELASGTGVLDVAGGKGKLSIELSLQGKIPCTIVDPLIRKHGDELDPREAKRMKKAQCPHPKLLSRQFNPTTFLDDCEDIVNLSSLLVGLHPDECTEDILDVALTHNKPVAIVPCCVFSGFFPLRFLPNEKPVRTYEDFLEYLLLKDVRLKSHILPFEGRNTVIYLGP